MAGAATSINEIETPAVLLDRERVAQNIRQMQKLADAHGVQVRPHIKTHKSPEIGRMQLAAGASGITAAKVDEALVFIEAGFRSVTLAYPLVTAEKLDRLFAAARAAQVDLRLIVDSKPGVEAISAAARRYELAPAIFIKIDVGLHRCGLLEDDPRLVELAQQVAGDTALRLVGILSHPGQAYGAPTVVEVRQIAQQEREIMARVRQRLARQGIELAEVSVGSTPTLLATEDFSGITEIRPGNYAFMDRTPLRFNLIGPERIALTVLATVVSRNAEYAIVDAGSKVLSSDRGAHGMAGMEGFGLAYPVDAFQQPEQEMIIAKLSEEHGIVQHHGRPLPVGSKVRIVPNHSCVAANLSDSYVVVEGDRVVDRWPVAARGKVR